MQGFVVVTAFASEGVIVCLSALDIAICKCNSELPNKSIRISGAASIGVTVP